MSGRFIWLVLSVALWHFGRRPTRALPLWLLAGLLGPWGLVLASLTAPIRLIAGVIARQFRRSAAREQVRKAVPGLLTDLAMAAAAGQPLHSALHYAGLWAEGPLEPVLAAFQSQVRGGASVAAALESLRIALETPETDRLVGLLSRDAHLGLPLGDSVTRYRRGALGDLRKELRRSAAYLPYVFTTLAGILLLEGVALIAVPWLLSLWRSVL